MSTFKTILDRRSIRKYTDEKISKEDQLKIVKAGMYAPSARNTRAWKFIVINDKEKLNQLAEAHPYGGMLKNAAFAILVCGDIKLEETKEYLAINCAAATQNMLLAAKYMDIGSVWLGVFPREKRMQDISNLLNLDKTFIPISLVSFGKATETKEFPQRFEENKIEFI